MRLEPRVGIMIIRSVVLQCDPGVGANAFYDFIYSKPQVIMMVGTRCSEVTKTLAEIAPYWNLLLVRVIRIRVLRCRVIANKAKGACVVSSNAKDKGY